MKYLIFDSFNFSIIHKVALPLCLQDIPVALYSLPFNLPTEGQLGLPVSAPHSLPVAGNPLVNQLPRFFTST